MTPAADTVTTEPPVRTGRSTRVLLADDSDGLRLLVRSWLSSVDDLEVVAEASNGAEAVALADAHRPDVVVLDVAMPVMDGLEALTVLHQRYPSLPVVMLSGFAGKDVADQATRRGAFAFVEKTGDLDPLVDVLRLATADAVPVPGPRPEPEPAPPGLATSSPAEPEPPDVAPARPPVPPPAPPASRPRTAALLGALPTLLAVLAFPALLAVRLQVDDVRTPVLLFLSVPILVLAVRHGLLGGLAAGVAASVLYSAWAVTVPAFHFGDLNHLTRFVVFLATGVVAGVAFDRLAREAEQRRQVSDAVVAGNRQLAEANERLSELNADLERSNADLRQFGYVASHDLAEPLRTMSSFAELLERRCADELGDDGRQYARFIADGAQRMQALITDLRDYTRTGSAELVRQPVDLQEVLEDVRAGLRATLEARGAVLRTGSLPVVPGDRSMLGLVFQNLVSNAVKFNAAAVPVVEVDAERAEGAWRVTVRDNGIGIDPAATERAFALFSRLHPPGTYEGTGLGLAITKRVVERHRGRIELARREGGGTAVTVTLPDTAGRRAS